MLACIIKMIDKNEKILYLTKHQESPSETSSSSNDVQVEKDDMFSQGHRAKITAVPIKEYAYKSDTTIKKEEINKVSNPISNT